MTACRGCMFDWPEVPERAYRAFMKEHKDLSFAMGGEDAAMNVHLVCEAKQGVVHVTRGVEDWLIKRGAVFSIVAEMRKRATEAPEHERADLMTAADTVAALLSIGET